MMKNNLRKNIYTGFTIAFLLIALISFFYYKSTADYIHSSEAVQRSTQRIGELEALLSLLKDAETGERGYIISQQDRFLEPYTLATSRINAQKDELKVLTENDPVYRRQLPQLDSLIATHIAFLDNNIHMVKNGQIQQVTEIVVSGQGKKLLDTIRTAIGHLQQHESKKLAILEAAAERDVFINYLVNYLGIGLTILLFVIGFFVITSDLTIREKLEKQLFEKNELLLSMNEELHAALEEATASNETSKEYANMLQQKNEILKYLNQELEAFSYTVSHDLQSPLHVISGYAGMLAQTTSVSQDKEIYRQIEIIEKNAARMDELINDLLRFSRLGKANIKKKDVDMQALVQQVMADMQDKHPLEKYSFIIGFLPHAAADKNLIPQVWTNLIGNAIKFSSRAAAPVIEISSEESSGKYVFLVRDNGIGFDPAQGDPFGVFKRLHNREQFAGNGIGLAIVERIIRHHGGEVWADSAPGRGATFHFTLPK
jgi:signal transduction histidine kinase